MFAVNYTLDEARGRVQLLHRLGHGAVPRPAGRSAAASSRHHDARRSAVRSREADRRQHLRPRRGADRRLAVQHHRRDPVGPAARLNGSAIQLDPGRRAAERASSRSSAGSTTAARRSTTRGRTARSRGACSARTITASIKDRFHDVNEPTEPQWSFSFFKTSRIGGDNNLQLRVEAFNVFNTRVYGGPNTNPASANFGIVDTASQVNFPRTIQLGVRMAF